MARERVKDKVCIVTAAAVPGRAEIARALANEGAKLALTEKDAESLESVAAGLDLGADRLFIRDHDITSAESWQSAVDKTLRTFGRIDVLVQGLAAGYLKPITETSLDEYRAVNEQNIEACFLGLKTVFPAMKAQGGGSIVNVTSVYGAVGMADAAALCASAGAVKMMTKAAALEGAEKDKTVRVNGILAGDIEGDLVDRLTKTRAAAGPSGSKGTLADVAELAVFLASDDSHYMTGDVIPVDGGILAA